MKTNFWDFCAPIYDTAAKANSRAYGDMLKIVRGLVPQGSTVLELAAGTGAISLIVSDKAGSILCSDWSVKMLAVAQRKAAKLGVKNVSFERLNIFETGKPDNSFDVVIASQVLNLFDNPEDAAAELRRVAKHMVILPTSFIKDLRGSGKLSINVCRLFGFAPKFELDAASFSSFLPDIGFENCDIIQIPGRIPMAVAVWNKTQNE